MSFPGFVTMSFMSNDCRPTGSAVAEIEKSGRHTAWLAIAKATCLCYRIAESVQEISKKYFSHPPPGLLS